MSVKLKKNCFLVLLVLMAVTFSGCMVGPDYVRPETYAESEQGYYNSGKHQQGPNDFCEVNAWWERFGDPVTSELVLEALDNSYDLRAAAARVLQARAAFEVSSGKRLPEISYNLSRGRGKTSFSFGGGRFSNLTTTVAHDISVGYVLDLFGKLKRAERAAWADLLATENNEQALVNAMIAGVIKARIDIATIQRGLVISKADIDGRRNTLEIVERRHKRGLAGALEIRLARANLAGAEAFDLALERRLLTNQLNLDVLLARRPGSTSPLAETLPDLPSLEPVPVGMPASLLDRRPDVKAAEMVVRAGNERIGVSIAQLYPDLTLRAAYGRSADRFRDLFIPETEIYSAVFGLTQPIFKGGQLRAQVKGAEAAHEEAAVNYAKTVANAMKEVEDALVSEELLGEQLEYVQVQVKESEEAERISRKKYRQGVENLLVVLEAERRRRLAENDLALLKGEIWTTRVNLFLALGGDWVRS